MSQPVILLDQGEFVGLSGATSGDVLTWNGTAWVSSPNGNGTVTSITAGAGLSGGTITTSGTISMPNVGTASTYGSASSVPVITTDAQGRVSSVAPSAIAIAQSQVTNLVDDLAGKVSTSTQVIAGTGLSGGGALSGDVTLSLPNVGTQGEYGSASSVAVVTTDQQGRVSGATTTTIAITQSQVADLVTALASKADKSVTATASTGLTGGGTLASNFSFALDTFGTAQTDQGTASKTVKISTDAYGRVSSLTEQDIAGLDAGVITSGQLSLAQGGTGIDASAVTDGQLLVGGTGTLALQNVSQDGSLASDGKLTVTGLQANAVSATVLGVPDAGKALVWSGSEWQASTIQGGGGGGGLVLYMNYAASSPYPLDTTFDENAIWDTGAITVANDAAGTELARFLTSVAFVIEVIPAGIWDVNVYAQASGALNDTAVRAKVGVWDGSMLTILGTSDYTYLTDPSVLTQYKASVYVPTTDLASGERIAIVIEGRRFAATTQTVTSYFGTGAISHVHSTLNAPGGTGLLKVVDGYLQSPASALVNADVASDAAIAVAKLAAGTNDYVLTTVSGVPTWNPPASGGVSSLTGTADQVLVDASSGTPMTGALTLTLPQSIASISSPTFAGLTLDAFSGLLRATAGVLSSGASVSLISEVSGTLPILNGGTNLTSSGANGNLLVSDGSAWASVPMTGDATIASTGALALKNTGSAGTYGSASAVPVFVTDAQGRVTSATNTNIDFAGNTVTSLTGTANQVILTGGPTGAITLALPQSIATTSSPTFSSMTLGGTLSFSALAYFRPASDNAIRLQPNTGNSFFFFGETRSTGTAVSAFFQGGAASGTVTTGGSAIIYGGSGTGTNTSGGNVSIEGGIATGSGTVGQITIGVSTTPRTSSVTIGRSAITTTINGTLVSNGTIIAATAAVDTNTQQVATTAYVIGQGYLKSATAASTYAPLASPTFTGTVTIPAGASISGFAPLASPTFTGTPLSTTAAADNNSTQIATTAYVVGQASSSAPVMDGSATIGTSFKYARADHVHPSDTSRAPLASPTFTGTVKATQIEVVEEVKLTSNAFTSIYTRSPDGGTTMSIEGDWSSASEAGGKLSLYAGRDYVGSGGGNLELYGGLAYVGAAAPGFVRIGGGSSISPATGVGADVIIDGGSGGVGADNGSIQLGTFTTKQINIGAATANTIQLRGPVTVTDTIALGNFATAGTAAVSTNTTQIATTAFVVGQASTLVPFMDGSAAIGTELKYARADHVHPSDTSRAPVDSPTFTGTVTLPLATAGYVKTTSGGVISSSATVAVADLSGAVAVANGGTNNASLSVVQGTVYYGNGSQLVGLAPGTNGQFLQTQGAGADPQWAAAGGGGGGGTVTSITAGAGLSGGTITTSGTISMPSVGTTGTYGAASSVPVFVTDAQGRVTGVTDTPIAIGASAITSGTLALANGGTNANLTATAGGSVYGTGTALAVTAAGTSGQFLKSNGALAPTWVDAPASASAPYDLRGMFVGNPASSAIIDRFVADRAATISTTSTNHKFSAGSLPSAGSVVLTVQRTRTTLGVPATVTVFTATSSSTDTILNGYYPMTISAVTNGDLLADDVLEVVVQVGAVDASFATIVYTISAVA